MQAPIALFVYNRYEHTKHVLHALNENKDADKSELFIFSDAPSDDTERENVNKVRECIIAYKKKSNFKRMEVQLAENNKGLSKSLIEGISQIINQYGKIIVLEDDLVTSPDFIVFMNRALDYYENDKKIWSVSGFTPDLKILHKYKHDVYCGCRGYCWGWATWKDRFEKVDWDVKDYVSFMADKKAQRRFNNGGWDMTPLLRMQREGKIDSWAIRWCYQEYKENMLTIFPRHSKVKNIGFDGTGVNSGKGNVFQARLKAEEEWDFSYDEQDQKVFTELKNYHSKLYIRQLIGKCWYELTEFEYCLVYRFRDEREKKYRVMKPTLFQWYAEPMLFRLGEKRYIFMEVFDKAKKKSYIGVSHFKDRKVSKPIKVIEEPFSISFPNIFTYKDQIYMVLACGEVGQIRIYRMTEKNIERWQLYYIYACGKDIVDISVYVEGNSKIYFLASEVNKNNVFQSRLILFRAFDLQDINKVQMELAWRQEGYSFHVRNGGGFMHRGKELYRVAQHSTRENYGKFVTLNKVELLGDDGFCEKVMNKKTISDIKADLPSFIYRVWGTHTFGWDDLVEVADLSVQRFSLGGLLWKVNRRICGVGRRKEI